jgi:hypothetical protein
LVKLTELSPDQFERQIFTEKQYLFKLTALSSNQLAQQIFTEKYSQLALRQFAEKMISSQVQQTNSIAVLFDVSAKRAMYFVIVCLNSEIVHQLQFEFCQLVFKNVISAGLNRPEGYEISEKIGFLTIHPTKRDHYWSF